MTTSTYHSSLVKSVLDILVATGALLVTSPAFLVVALLLKLANHGPVFFLQERTGKNGKKFKMIKFRSMFVGAEKEQNLYKKINEADGPVFKIHEDPRFTPIGRILAHMGLDELPQLFNVLRREMSMVGPRPLPVNEAKRIPAKYKLREKVLPGMTSSWITNGSHDLSFKQWMELDLTYVKDASLFEDIAILADTFRIIVRSVIREVIKLGRFIHVSPL